MKILKTSIKWKGHQLKEGKDQEGNDRSFLQNFPVFACQGGLHETEVTRSGTEPRACQTQERTLTALHGGGNAGATQQDSMLQLPD